MDSGTGADQAAGCTPLVPCPYPLPVPLPLLSAWPQFGKVYKATWRGTIVAVKRLLLPSDMSGALARGRLGGKGWGNPKPYFLHHCVLNRDFIFDGDQTCTLGPARHMCTRGPVWERTGMEWLRLTPYG